MRSRCARCAAALPTRRTPHPPPPPPRAAPPFAFLPPPPSLSLSYHKVLARPRKMCNFIEWQGKKVVYKRYASLYFIACVDESDNELLILEQIHHFVEVLDRYFGSVCELDIIFNFHKAYFIVDELFIGGALIETSKKKVLSFCGTMDDMMEDQAKRR